MDVCNATHRAMARTLREAWDGHDASGYLRWLSDVGPDTIADLIDRPTCQMRDCDIDHGECSWGMRCSACGAEFEYQRSGYGWRYCPSCGAEVIKSE